MAARGTSHVVKEQCLRNTGLPWYLPASRLEVTGVPERRWRVGGRVGAVAQWWYMARTAPQRVFVNLMNLQIRYDHFTVPRKQIVNNNIYSS